MGMSGLVTLLKAEDYRRVAMAIKKRRGGFTLIEIMTVVGIIAAMAGMIIPLALRATSTMREQATIEELETLKKAIIGEARATIKGEEFSFGFVGDIGGVPTSIERLLTRGTLPAFSFDFILKIGAGWNGPYSVKKFGSDITKDPYGNDYSYSTTPGTNVDLGVSYLARITSPGLDNSLGTSDDLTIQILEPEVRSDIFGFIKDSLGAGIPAVDVTIHYPSEGTLTTTTTTTNLEGFYSFTDIPIGDRAITVDPKLLYKSNTAITVAPTGKDLKFTVEDFSESAIIINSLKAEYNVTPAAFYEKIIINGVAVYNWPGVPTPRAGSGTIVSFSPITISANTVSKEPFLVRMQSNKVETADMVIGRFTTGGRLDIELQNFKDSPTDGNAVDMTGVPFKITFSNGSVVVFTPKKA